MALRFPATIGLLAATLLAGIPPAWAGGPSPNLTIHGVTGASATTGMGRTHGHGGPYAPPGYASPQEHGRPTTHFDPGDQFGNVKNNNSAGTTQLKPPK
mgnify:CR=1 FL=1